MDPCEIISLLPAAITISGHDEKGALVMPELLDAGSDIVEGAMAALATSPPAAIAVPTSNELFDGADIDDAVV